ncbi:MAG: hypothetical protein ABSG53_29635, partial [Thermoguttaceae bacterium]
MFRRRTDFSWPLIIVLVGLFFLSLKLPRQWERIARPTPLVLKAHNSLQAKELPSVVGSQGEISSLESFRSIRPTGYVASNNDALASSTPSGSNEVRPAVVVPVVVAKSPAPEVVSAAAPLEEPVKVAATVEGSRDRLADTPLLPAPSTSPQPILPLPQVGAKSIASAAPEKMDEVRVLRDVPASITGPSLAADSAVSSEPEVRRLPPPETVAIQAQPSDDPGEGSGLARQPAPSPVAPEPAVAVEPSPAIAETAPNPVRPVVPEPQPTAEQSLPSTGPQPALSQPNPLTAAESVKPADSANPAERADVAAPPATEPAATEPPMRAIGRAWEEPAHLLVQLEELKKHEITQGWAIEVTATVHRLGPAISVGLAQTTE